MESSFLIVETCFIDVVSSFLLMKTRFLNLREKIGFEYFFLSVGETLIENKNKVAFRFVNSTNFQMTFQEVFKDKHLLLPRSIPEGKENNYRSFLNELFEKYIELLKNVEPTSRINITGVRTRYISKVIPIQEKFIEGIKEALTCYFDGRPAKSYLKFKEIIEYRKKKHEHLFNINDFEVDENFYRIRKKEENFPFSSLEMFHIPFQDRGKVSTQRYSIPGFPSLYLGKTLYVAWEELNRPSLDSFQAVRLKSRKKIRYLDLTPTDWGHDNLDKAAYKYLMTWPLIAACSIKVKHPSDTFKPEYIIPQLLLQWIREEGKIKGIKYNSTHVEKSEIIGKGDLYNLVLPVKDNEDKGYCKDLIGLFEITEAISKQLLDYSSGGNAVLYQKAEVEAINRKIPSLEIIKGRKMPYGASVLGKMELFLDKMETKKIQ